MSRWVELLEAQGVLVADGAMGTQLFTVGLAAGDPPEAWNVDHPDRIRGIHRSYVEAGSDIILSNSFGCLLYTSPSPRDYAAPRMPSSA